MTLNPKPLKASRVSKKLHHRGHIQSGTQNHFEHQHLCFQQNFLAEANLHMENKMETTALFRIMLYRGYIGILESKMETIILSKALVP